MTKRVSSSAPSTTDKSSDKSKPKPSPANRAIVEDRRLRNIESAKRSRDRLQNEPSWMKVQVSENNQRIRQLEKTMDDLERTVPGSRVSSKKNTAGRPGTTEKRPKWYGDAF